MNKLDILAQKEEELRKLNEEIEKKNKNLITQAQENEQIYKFDDNTYEQEVIKDQDVNEDEDIQQYEDDFNLENQQQQPEEVDDDYDEVQNTQIFTLAEK